MHFVFNCIFKKHLMDYNDKKLRHQEHLKRNFNTFEKVYATIIYFQWDKKDAVKKHHVKKQ
jgi:hypothetical protein